MIRVVIGVLIAWIVGLTAQAAAQAPASYALIVTSNRSPTTTRPDLHYADDDGVQYAQLFGELLGPDRVTLLTQLDAETAALHPEAKPRAPTHANLNRAIGELAGKLRAAHDTGTKSVVYLVFAGHGDVDHGQGYIDLADGRLSARELDERVIAPLPADRIHLVLDSCNSYFLLNPRKPGGTRWQTSQGAARDLLSKYPQLGALLSTSAEAVTYEWSEIQSGVFSYEVRAGLRGAADVNDDGRISYAELAGFIRVANRPVRNDLYRPKVFSRAPSADTAGPDATFAERPAAVGRRLILGAPDNQRLTLRDPQGVRVMDLHKEAGTALSLTLPSAIALTAQEQIPGPERPQWVEREVPDGQQLLAAVPQRPAAQIGRGEPPLFNMLFAEPFGKRAFARVRLEATDDAEPPSGVTIHDVDRLKLHLSLMASTAKQLRTNMGVTLGLCSALPLAALTYTVYQSSDHRGDWIARTGVITGLVVSVEALVLSLYFLAVPWSEEHFATEFAREDVSSERARSSAVPRAEQRLKELSDASRRGRKLGAWAMLIGGALLFADGGFLMGEDAAHHSAVRLQGPLNLAMGVAEVLFGLYALWTEGALERTWDAYSSDPAVNQRLETR